MHNAHPRDESAEAREARFTPIRTGDDYVESLRDRPVEVYLFGERVAEPVDHPIIRPSINALRATYELALSDPDLATAHSALIGARVNRFLHIVESPADLVMKNRMQRRLGQLTGTCFQRCAGLDTISVLHSITFDIDAKHGTSVPSALSGDFMQPRAAQQRDHWRRHDRPEGRPLQTPQRAGRPRPVSCASPAAPRPASIVSGAKAHMTGGLNSPLDLSSCRR